MEPRRVQSTSLIDILDRILDKGLVVAGDVRVSLANVELLTIRIRLLVCSIDKAEQIGLNWWRYDTSLVAQEESDHHHRATRKSHHGTRATVGGDHGHPPTRPTSTSSTIPHTKEVNDTHASR